jgi:phenylpropionate dioxygenase-like ring-hydroxylating dioxygenase large terminal subunit
MGVDYSDIKQGFATSVSPLVKDLLKEDSRPLESALRETGDFFVESKKIPFKRYFDPEFAKLEMEHVWKKCWQVVGREEDIPEIGDRKLYEVGELSYIIVRSGENEFRALQNACLHRGTRLCNGSSSAKSIKCPFHAWEWNLDGSLKNIPSRWDFPDVKDDDYRLPEAKIGRWGGFLLINPDPDAGPLEDALGVLPKHFSKRESEDRFTVVGFRKKLRANWKQAQEAFLEAYHVIEVHSNVMTYNGDTTTRYDTWDDGKSQVSRSITPAAVPSGHLGEEASRLRAAQEALKTFALPFPGIDLPEIKSAETGRAEVAEWRRQVMSQALDVDFSRCSDSYMLDATQYFVFPNFWPWFGEGLPLTYQFTPYGSDPNECVMETRLTLPVPENGPRPPAAELIDMDFDTPCWSIPALGIMASVFDQDFSNLPLVQIGLRSARDPDAAVTLGRYQESRIQAFQDMIDRKIAGK